MMAYLVLNYDLKLEGEAVRPDNVHITTTIAPNPSAKVLFKKRRTVL